MDDQHIVDTKSQECVEPQKSSLRHLFPTWSDLIAILGLFFLSQVITRAVIALFAPSDVLSQVGEITKCAGGGVWISDLSTHDYLSATYLYLDHDVSPL